MSEAFRDIAAQYLHAHDVLIRVSECPFAYATPQFLGNDAYVKNARFFVLELKEHHETFLEKKEQTIKCLNSVKSGKRLRLLGGGKLKDDTSKFEQEMELCKSIQKLFFHVKVLYDSYRSMVRHFESCAARHEQVRNLSAELTSMHEALICGMTKLSEPSRSPPPIKGGTISPASLAQLLQTGNVRDAISLLRFARDERTRAIFGCCDEEDVEVLLLFYCQMLADNYPCCMMVVESLEENYALLQDTFLSLTAAISGLEESQRVQRPSIDASIGSAE
jgi:hypothetical protein